MKNPNKEERKIFILDTSVMLYDKCSIHSFGNNDVLIPLVALDELDRFKDKRVLLVKTLATSIDT